MNQTNRNNRPVFSCVWLAGIVLVGTSSADELPDFSTTPPPSIVVNSEQHSKPQPESTQLDLFDIAEGIRIATHNPFAKASSPVTDEATVSNASQQHPIPKDAQPATNQQDTLIGPEPPVIRPLSSITLASAGRAESLEGQPLKQPESHAVVLLAPHGTWQDISGYRPNPFPRHNHFSFAHDPLYFEDPDLERLGRTDGYFTELTSAANFFGRIPLLPYQMGSNPPHSCVPSLGNYSPRCSYGHHAYIPPLNSEGVALQAACTVGLVFLIP